MKFLNSKLLRLLSALVLTFSVFSVSANEASDAFTIVFLGDSLTEGYGLSKDSAFPALVGEKLKAEKPNLKVINAGVSGSTSAGGVSRLNWVLKSKPDLLVVALGANDGLRGLSRKEMKNNLSKIVNAAQEKKVPVVLLGMKMPPNYGPGFTKDFEKVFEDVATETKVPFFPFLLDGVAGKADMNLPDGIHPNEKGHAHIAEKLYPFLKRYL